MSLEDLLSVDVESEIDKLLGRSLPRPEAAALEAVRALFRLGAERVDVHTSGGAVVALGVGARISEEAGHAWQVVHDVTAAAAIRHRALEMAEESLGLGCLAALGRHGRLQASAEGVRLVLGHRLDGGRVQRALAEACRYSERSVSYTGRRLDGAVRLDDVLVQGQLTLEGLPVLIGLPRTGELGRLVWVVDEVVAAEEMLTPPSGGPFLAIIRGARQRGVRRSVQAAADSLLVELLGRFDELLPWARATVQARVFRRCQRTGKTAWMADVPMFTTAGSGRRTLAQLLAADTVWATTTMRAARAGRAPAEALVLSREERELLAWAGVMLVAPPPSPSLAQRLFASCRRVFSRSPRSGAVVDSGGLQELAAAIETQLRSGAFVVGSSGVGASDWRLVPARRARLPLTPVAREGAWEVRLPVGDARVRQAAAALSRDPRAIYWIMPALFGGEDGWSGDRHELRRAFIG
jgi:hypothetical protein